jgi:hypothetical protein
MISVVIPLYNEEDNIADLQQELAAALAGIEHEVVFVDDGSQDRTLERIRRGPGTRILAFVKNTGQSAAMYEGIHAARGEIIVLLDGDLQNDPKDIPRLLAEIEKGADLVCGYRAKRRDNQKNLEPRGECDPEPVYEGWRARHRLHAQGDAAGVPGRAGAVPGDAPVYPGAGEGDGVQACGDSGESPSACPRREQIQIRQPGVQGDERYVRGAVAAEPAVEVRGEGAGGGRKFEIRNQKFEGFAARGARFG